MTTRIKSGDTVIFDTDNWSDLDCRYYVHSAEYTETSTAVNMYIEDCNGNTLVRSIAHHQIIKV